MVRFRHAAIRLLDLYNLHCAVFMANGALLADTIGCYPWLGHAVFAPELIEQPRLLPVRLVEVGAIVNYSCPFTGITRPAKRLNIVNAVCATKSSRNYVIDL